MLLPSGALSSLTKQHGRSHLQTWRALCESLALPQKRWFNTISLFHRHVCKHGGLFISAFLKAAFGRDAELISVCGNVSLQRSLLVSKQLLLGSGSDGAAAVPFGHIYLEG